MTRETERERVLAAIEAQGGWGAIWERVAAGETQDAIAASLGISQGFFSTIMNADPTRTRAFKDAKRQYASVADERTGELLKNVKEDRDAIAKVREQANHARWQASHYDRETYGDDKPDLTVNLFNTAQLHLDALRHRFVEPPNDTETVPDWRTLPALPGADQGPDAELDKSEDGS